MVLAFIEISLILYIYTYLYNNSFLGVFIFFFAFVVRFESITFRRSTGERRLGDSQTSCLCKL